MSSSGILRIAAMWYPLVGGVIIATDSYDALKYYDLGGGYQLVQRQNGSYLLRTCATGSWKEAGTSEVEDLINFYEAQLCKALAKASYLKYREKGWSRMHQEPPRKFLSDFSIDLPYVSYDQCSPQYLAARYLQLQNQNSWNSQKNRELEQKYGPAPHS